MREIKFRAWNGHTIVNDWLVFKEMALTAKDAGMRIVPTGLKCEALSVMQYTGLKDKNGVEIWEGDIVKGYWQTSDSDAEFVEAIEWAYDRYLAGGYDLQDVERSYEVIGNIYEHSHLIKE